MRHLIFNFFLLLLLQACTHVFYYPSRIVYALPEQYGLDFKELGIKSANGRTIVAWLISDKKTSEKQRKLVVQFHGNAENMSSHFLSLKWLVEKGYDLLIFDYQGYGPSEGKPSPENLRADALALLNYVESNLLFKREKYVVYGQSLGGNVLTDGLIHKKDLTQIKAVVIDSSFPSYQEIAQEKLRAHWLTWIFWPLTHVLIDDSSSVYSGINSLRPLPFLFMISGEDRVVSPKLSRKFAEAYKGPKQIITVEGANHLQVYHGPYVSYRDKLLKFLENPSR